MKPEFPPLLAPGFHVMTVAGLRAMCVISFPTSVTRPLIMPRLESVIARVSKARIIGELWIDGSFVTEKIDPDDVDILIRVAYEEYVSNPAKSAVVDWASNVDLVRTHSCDAYRWIEYSRGHPSFRMSDTVRENWTRTFGKSLRGVPKGIAVILLPAS